MCMCTNILVFRIVGGVSIHCMQYIALLGQCVGFRALVQEWFKLSRVKPSMLFISTPLFLYQCAISVLASLRMCYEMISYLTQRARNHKKTFRTPTQMLCNYSSISEVFQTWLLLLSFWQLETGEFISLWCVYVHAHMRRCNHSPAFVYCRDISREKDNNRQSRNLLIQLCEWKSTRLLNKWEIKCVCRCCSLLLFVCSLKFRALGLFCTPVDRTVWCKIGSRKWENSGFAAFFFTV